MPDGHGPVLSLQGKVDADNALEVVQAASGVPLVPGPPTPIANLQGVVDDQGRLKVRVV